MNALKTTLLLGILTLIIIFVGGQIGGRQGMVIAFAIAAVTNLGSYWFSDRIVLAATRARPAGEADYPRLHAIVASLAQRAGIPKPRVFILPEQAPNAFATGRSRSNAVVAVTEGLMALMDDEELEGVLAHELGHVLNRDILVASLAATLAGAVMMLATFARWGAIFGGGRSDREGRGGGGLGLLVAAIVAPFAATIIRSLVSQSREYGADDAGARLAGNPVGLARALQKLGQASGRIPMNASPVTHHLFIVAPLSAGERFRSWMSTHPPLEKRIARLMARKAP